MKLKYCNKCAHKTYYIKDGVLCKITNSKPAKIDACNDTIHKIDSEESSKRSAIKNQIIDSINNNLQLRKEAESKGTLWKNEFLDFLVKPDFDWKNYNTSPQIIIKDSYKKKTPSFIIGIFALGIAIYLNLSEGNFYFSILLYVIGFMMISFFLNRGNKIIIDQKAIIIGQEPILKYSHIVFINFKTVLKNDNPVEFLEIHLNNEKRIQHNISFMDFEKKTLGKILYTKIKAYQNNS